MSVETWSPARIDPAQATLDATLSRRRAPAQGAGWTVTTGPAQPIDDAEPFAIVLGGHPARLEVPAALVEATLLALDPAAPAAQGVARRLLLELAVEDALGALESWVDVAPPDAPGADLPLQAGLRLMRGGAAWDAVLRLSSGAAEALGAALATLEPAPVLPDIRVPLVVLRGACDLTLQELRTLQPGDVLLPGAGFEGGADGPLLLVAHPRMVWQVRADPGAGMVVTTPRSPASSLGLEGWMMDEQVPGPLVDAELDALPVRLVFEAGRIEVPVGELSQIGPGHVFPLPDRAGLVDIVAAGRRIGQGELVQVGDGAGVRVLRLTPG